MAAVPVGWNTDLSEGQFGPAWRPLEVEGVDRMVLRPPPRRPPRLHDLPTWFQREVEAGNVPIPGAERTANPSADHSFLARQRGVLAGHHDEVIHLPGGYLVEED